MQTVDTLRTSTSTCAMTSAILGMGGWDGLGFFIWTGEGIVNFFPCVVIASCE